MKLEVKYTTKFTRELALAAKQNKNIDLLFEVVEKLANQEILAPKFNDHKLIGNYVGCRECHITSDWLLIYQVFNDELTLLLTRVGSHSKLF